MNLKVESTVAATKTNIVNKADEQPKGNLNGRTVIHITGDVILFIPRKTIQLIINIYNVIKEALSKKEPSSTTETKKQKPVGSQEKVSKADSSQKQVNHKNSASDVNDAYIGQALKDLNEGQEFLNKGNLKEAGELALKVYGSQPKVEDSEKITPLKDSAELLLNRVFEKYAQNTYSKTPAGKVDLTANDSYIAKALNQIDLAQTSFIEGDLEKAKETALEIYNSQPNVNHRQIAPLKNAAIHLLINIAKRYAKEGNSVESAKIFNTINFQ